MSKITNEANDHVSFRCPGCGNYHILRVRKPGDGKRSSWEWNGDYERPTFTPSVLFQSGHYAKGFIPGSGCWCDEPDFGYRCVRCHSYVTDGQIQFLGDCSHSLKGQTVPLPDIDNGGE